MVDSPWQGGRALISVLALAQLLAPVKPTSAVGARAPAFAMPLGVRAPSMQGRVPSACPLRCASESGIAMREEKGSEEETETCVFEAVEQSSWVMGTGVSSEKEPEESAENDVLLLAVSDKFQRQTTLGYLTWMQEEMEMQESRQRREDDFGETDDEAGGVREYGYEKKSKNKTLNFLKSSAEGLVASSQRGGKTIERSLDRVPWWRKVFGKKAKDKMRDQEWLEGLK